jgi:hypothetical protein
MISTIIDDVANWRHLSEVLELAGEGEIPLERLRRMACGSASRADVDAYGDHWTKTLVDLLQRGGIGRLERRGDGVIMFTFVEPAELPSADEAWDGAFADGDLHE